MAMLKTNFKRLYKSKAFYIFLFVILLTMVRMVIAETEYLASMKVSFDKNYILDTWRGSERIVFYGSEPGQPYMSVDTSVELSSLMDFDIMNYFFSGFSLIIFLMAIFNVFFLSQEHSERTINNYVIRGIKRSTIFISGFISVLLTDLFYVFTGIVAMRITALIYGYDILKFSNIKAYILPELIVIAAISAISTLLAFIIRRRNIAIILITIMMLGIINLSGQYELYIDDCYTQKVQNSKVEYVINETYAQSKSAKKTRISNILCPTTLNDSCRLQNDMYAFNFDYSFDDNKLFIIADLMYITVSLGYGYFVFSRKELT